LLYSLPLFLTSKVDQTIINKSHYLFLRYFATNVKLIFFKLIICSILRYFYYILKGFFRQVETQKNNIDFLKMTTYD
jgi:hypothetical protein